MVGVQNKFAVGKVNFAKSLSFCNWIRLMMSFIKRLIYQESASVLLWENLERSDQPVFKEEEKIFKCDTVMIFCG